MLTVYALRASRGGGTRTHTHKALVPKTSVSAIPPHPVYPVLFYIDRPLVNYSTTSFCFDQSEVQYEEKPNHGFRILDSQLPMRIISLLAYADIFFSLSWLGWGNTRSAISLNAMPIQGRLATYVVSLVSHAWEVKKRAGLVGFEPTTFWLTVRRCHLLSYSPIILFNFLTYIL